MTLQAGDLWRPPDYDPDTASPNFTWAYLASWGGHPGTNPRKLPIRRWRSNVAGPARVLVTLSKSDASGGDGIGAIVVLDGVELLRQAIAGTDGVGIAIPVDVELRDGAYLDYLIDPLTSDGQDTSNHGLRIESR